MQQDIRVTTSEPSIFRATQMAKTLSRSAWVNMPQRHPMQSVAAIVGVSNIFVIASYCIFDIMFVTNQLCGNVGQPNCNILLLATYLLL